MYSIMEKKVYHIRKWDYLRDSESIDGLERSDFYRLDHAKFYFVSYANELLRLGCVIEHVNNPWSYELRSKEGICFGLYMYED